MNSRPLNTNNARQDFWKNSKSEVPDRTFNEALKSLHPVSALVLRLRYEEDYELNEIAQIIGKSISIVRNHHNRGIFKLQQFFLAMEN
jgi:RNA polymerase sigma factor (sigma-70 family)